MPPKPARSIPAIRQIRIAKHDARTAMGYAIGRNKTELHVTETPWKADVSLLCVVSAIRRIGSSLLLFLIPLPSVAVY